MSGFEEARAGLREARDRAEAHSAELDRSRRRVSTLAARLTRTRRVEARRESGEVRRLEAELEQASKEEAVLGQGTPAFAAAVAAAGRAFAAVSSTQEAIGKWSGDIPILLLPVRLETRFRESELWVRIYPDDCSVDSFEPLLTDEDIAVARQFWTAVWAAGGIESERRAAWRELVRARGVGRAEWIVRHYAPAGPEPAKSDPSSLLLVVAATALPPTAEQSALADYWTAVWKADGAAGAIGEAAAGLALALGMSPGEASELAGRFTPANLSVRPLPPARKADSQVAVAWLALPEPGETRSGSWTSPARVTILPDRFVILGYQGDQLVLEAEGTPIPSPLIVGPDPSAPPEDQLRHLPDGSLEVPEDMRWMTDFDRAVEVGMGIRIPLDSSRFDASRPISRLVAIGLRSSEDSDEGSKRLEQLLTAHRYGSGGFSLVPQGSPTNNTEGSGAGARDGSSADLAYDLLFASSGGLAPTGEWERRQDGQWLAEALGLDPLFFAGIANASGRDVAEARAMNRLLWPASLGYAMETTLHPLFGADAVDSTRWFYTHFVAGRGFLPAVRIGRQPYGILPAMALSHWKPGNESIPGFGGLDLPPSFGAFLQRLAGVLATARQDWEGLAGSVATVDRAGDAHQILLDIVGLHPASVEFHQRYSEGLAFLFNRMKFDGLGGRLLDAVSSSGLEEPAMQLLRRLGYQGNLTPEGLQRFFFSRAQSLNGPVIDDRPLSESDPVRAYATGGRNYLEWAAEAVRQSFEDLRQERGFIGEVAPDALLYVVLRHALLLGYWDSALRLHVENDAVDEIGAREARAEPAAIHVSPERLEGSESRYSLLYSRDARVSGDEAVTVGERIRTEIGHHRSSAHLADQLSALDLIKDLPTARLERCFAEHLDTAGYRLDSWLLGLVHLNLASMRYAEAQGPEGSSAEATTRRGLYLGAYGWLENLERSAPLETVELGADLGEVFAGGGAPLLKDPANGGFVMAPSVGQATTAAILRAGYIANSSPDAPDALGVDLTSSRVRLALGLIEAIRSGQPLGAVLGYCFQRRLHEDHRPLELDGFIHAIRSVFPLVANNIRSTEDPSAPVESIEANNVIDGLKLLERVRQPANRQYPFGLPLPTASPEARAAIDFEVDRLLEAHDALADLALAEGVHQAVLGNYGAVGAALDAYSKGSFPPEPEFVRTPRGGVTLTHRVGVQFDPSAASSVPVESSPRAHALAPMNQWLSTILPQPAQVGCRVEWRNPVSGAVEDEIVTQADLALQPVDLLHVATLDGSEAMDELDDRIVRHVLSKRAPRGDAVLSVRHTERLARPLKSFFELAPLCRHLRELLLSARSLVPTDIALPGEARQAQDVSQSIARTLASEPADALAALAGSLAAFDAASGSVDQAIEDAVALLERSARFGLPQSGWGYLYAWRTRLFGDLILRLGGVVDRWRDRLGQFDAAATAYDSSSATLSDVQRFEALARMDLMVAGLPVSPRPATPDDYDNLLRAPSNPQARRRLFEEKLEALEAVLANGTSNLGALIAAIQAELPLDAFDLAGLPVDDVVSGVAAFRNELQLRIVNLKADVDQRLAAAGQALEAHDQSASPGMRVEALQSAATAVFGPSVKLVPEFTLAPDHSAEIANAYGQGLSGDLFQYWRSTKTSEEPVEDWLHGIARVRAKMRALEQAGLFAPVLGGAEPTLTALQLPYRAGDSWLGLEFDPAQPLAGDRLLYTAHFAVAPGAGAICGLLLDEWTEVLPARDETAGLSFHFDRPGSEPPQAWLLATPAGGRGPWRWDDLVGAVTETFALARLRAVEPTQVDSTPYAAFLPATVSASSLRGISIAADFANVNGASALVRGEADG